VSTGNLSRSPGLGDSGESLDEKYGSRLSVSGGTSATSPFGPLTDKGARKTFFSLVNVMDSSYPDYDWRYPSTARSCCHA
jgi:hypothetical protein